MSLEKELRDQLAYELSDIEGFSEVWLDALDTVDALVAACELAAAVQAFAGLGLTVRGGVETLPQIRPRRD
jgi:hypothetical protein